MKYKVGVNVVGKNGKDVYTLWTLDGYKDSVREFDTLEEAKDFGDLVWPKQYVVDTIQQEEKE